MVQALEDWPMVYCAKVQYPKPTNRTLAQYTIGKSLMPTICGHMYS